MLTALLSKIFGTKNDREVKRLFKRVSASMSLSHPWKRSHEQLAQKTIEFKERITQGATLHDILPEAFAAVREAASA